MKEELCKKLKEAGFPQGTNNAIWNWKQADEESYFEPTLSELIEACGVTGDKPIFKSVALHSNRKDQIIGTSAGKVNMGLVGRWCATARTKYKKENSNHWLQVNAWGRTPEEAVAKLWLALNLAPNK